MNTKLCRKCLTDKTVIEFSKKRASKDGLQETCKQCNKKNNDTYRKEHPDYWSYKDGYFSDSDKWKYISEYMAADKSIKIYKIELPNNKYYIGSTKALLNVRMSRHIQDYRRYINGNKDKTIPLLHKEFDNMFTNYEDLRDYLKSNTYILEETRGGRKRQMSVEQFWIDRYRKEGYKLCNKYNPVTKLRK